MHYCYVLPELNSKQKFRETTPSEIVGCDPSIHATIEVPQVSLAPDPEFRRSVGRYVPAGPLNLYEQICFKTVNIHFCHF